MVKYDNRATVEELLEDGFLKGMAEMDERLELPDEEQESLVKEIKVSAEMLRRQLKAELKKC